MYGRFPVSRLLCDVERFVGPEEVMEQYGMGFCYEKAYDGTTIKNVTDELREKTLHYYRKHHETMDYVCEQHPRILLFDMHSYSDEIVPDSFLHEGKRMPDLCIGTDDRYTPPQLTEIVKKRFSEKGPVSDINYPYSGCFIPNNVLSGRCKCDYVGIMLEFNKRIYCDESGKPVSSKLDAIRNIIRQVVADCVNLD